LLASYGKQSSMSRKGNCYESEHCSDAPMESFWDALKNESMHHVQLKTREQAKAGVFDYIEVFYHLIRPHEKLNNLTPRKFAQTYEKYDALIA
jgi:putative transposase